MPRQARLRIEGVPLHVIQRGNNRMPCFFGERDYRLYLGLIEELAPRFGCAVHAYVLMTNHVHVLVTPRDRDSVSNLMKHLGQRYVQFVNRHQHRTGGLWEGRFRSSLIDSETYLLRCQRYIEQNPVRAGMVAAAGHYTWSSHRENATGMPRGFLTPHERYMAYGMTPPERSHAYLEWVHGTPSDKELQALRDAVNGGFPLGSPEFLQRIAARFQRRVVRIQQRREAVAA